MSVCQFCRRNRLMHVHLNVMVQPLCSRRNSWRAYTVAEHLLVLRDLLKDV